ncbi:MAG TPA: aldo/keto reductase [Ardenticatenaceae bacterium]|nr:aldo/keto reductase [Ardenticatenaceae bacterium]
MDYVTLGRTGLHVSVLGLGGGGHSRLGQAAGAAEADSVALVQRALELGINFVDTAESYGTEPIVAKAIRGRQRRQVVLSTKKTIDTQDGLLRADDLVRGLEQSLARLGTDHVEVYHLHGVAPEHYDHAREHLVPTMLKLREQGKIGALGITERFASDPGHGMLSRAVLDDCWDVVMVGFNILNQSARDRVLRETLRRDVGVLCMFAVRTALSRPEKLQQIVAELAQQGLIDRDAVDLQDPLGFVTRAEGVPSLPDAAYRFCRAEPGIHVVLSGTGNVRHLEENVEAILKPPLPAAVRQRLVELFAEVDTVSGQ